MRISAGRVESGEGFIAATEVDSEVNTAPRTVVVAVPGDGGCPGWPGTWRPTHSGEQPLTGLRLLLGASALIGASPTGHGNSAPSRNVRRF